MRRAAVVVAGMLAACATPTEGPGPAEPAAPAEPAGMAAPRPAATAPAATAPRVAAPAAPARAAVPAASTPPLPSTRGPASGPDPDDDGGAASGDAPSETAGQETAGQQAAAAPPRRIAIMPTLTHGEVPGSVSTAVTEALTAAAGETGAPLVPHAELVGAVQLLIRSKVVLSYAACVGADCQAPLAEAVDASHYLRAEVRPKAEACDVRVELRATRGPAAATRRAAAECTDSAAADAARRLLQTILPPAR